MNSYTSLENVFVISAIKSGKTKLPLHPNGGTPVEDADMPLEQLDTTYEPDRVLITEDALKLPVITQNGDKKNKSN
jgi:hypothetical protein